MVAQTGSNEYMIAAWVGLRCFCIIFMTKIQAKDPKNPKQISGIIAPLCQVDSTTITSLEKITARAIPPKTTTANEVEVTAIGSLTRVTLSVR